MKKLLYIPILAFAIGLSSCGDEFLQDENLFEVSDESFYQNEEQINDALKAAYAMLPCDAGSNNATVVANLMSDDCFGGGGINDVGFHDMDAFTNSTEDNYASLWRDSYYGIFRANSIIARFDQAEISNQEVADQLLGEAYFLRAYFHFRLGKFFGNIPVKTTPTSDRPVQATPEELYGQISADLKTAIELMPATKYQSISTSRLGHATKWAAEALMARVFLFYTGYYEKSEIVTTDDESITKAQVIAWLDDLIANSGHGLLPDFRNQWPYAYATDTLGGYEYPYARNNNLNWIGEDGDNIETIFAIKYSPYGGWNAPNKLSYSNQLALYMGQRGQDLSPFGTGWGGGPCNPQLFDSYDDNDIRKKGTICDITDPEENCADYEWGVWEAMHETGLWQKKYTPIQVGVWNESTAKYDLKGMYFDLLGTPDDYQLWNMQDEVLIRYADVLLMAAELKEDAAPINEVRARAGLDPVSYSLDALKQERRHELAFEGLRYFDLLRWHNAEEAFAKVKDVPVMNLLQEATYTAQFRPETGGFLPIPESQIRLSQGEVGEMVQNPGW